MASEQDILDKKPGWNLSGRPKGAVSIHSQKAAKKLQELGFDPIAKMVELHEQLDQDIARILYDEDGEERDKYSAVALATLQSAKQKVISDLLRYGYARAPEASESSGANLSPVQINLTGTKVDFDTTRLTISQDAPMKGEDE